MLRIFTNLSVCLGAGLLWFVGNVWLGNLQALEYLGWLAAYPWFIKWVVAILPSASQLLITEQWGSGRKDEREQLDPLSMVFAGFVAIVIDLGGPVLGFFVVTGLPFDRWNLAGAIVVATFVSILCQHVAWVRGKATVAAIADAINGTPRKDYAKKHKPAQEVQTQNPIRLADKLQQPPVQHVNGKERANGIPAKDE